MRLSSPRSTCRGFTFCVFIFARMCPLQTGCAREQARAGAAAVVCCVMMLARSPRLMLRDKLCCWLELSRFDGEKLGWLFGLLEPASHDAPVGVPHACLSLSVRQATTMVVRGLGCAALCLPVSVHSLMYGPKGATFPDRRFCRHPSLLHAWRWVGVCVCEEFSRETRFHTPKAERGAVQLCFKSCCCC